MLSSFISCQSMNNLYLHSSSSQTHTDISYTSPLIVRIIISYVHVISHFESFKLPTIRMYFALKIFPKPIYKYDDIAMAVVMVCAVTCIPDALRHRITAFVVAVMVLFLFGLSSYSWQWFYHQNHQRHAIVIRIPTKIRGFSIKRFRSQKLCQIFNTVEVSEATEWVTDGIYMADAHTHTQRNNSSMAVSLWLSLCQKVVKFRAVRSLFIFMYIQQINMSCIFKFAKFYRGEYFTI